MIAQGQTFKDVVINLDGATFVGCKFERCTFRFSGLMPPVMNGNDLLDCRWQLAGPADNALQFLMQMYHGGMKELVEATFEQIRKGNASAAGPGTTLN